MSERYNWVKVIVDCGSLRWEYQLEGSCVIGRMSHDENVSDWTAEDIIDLTKNILNIKKGEVPLEVEYR